MSYQSVVESKESIPVNRLEPEPLKKDANTRFGIISTIAPKKNSCGIPPYIEAVKTGVISNPKRIDIGEIVIKSGPQRNESISFNGIDDLIDKISRIKNVDPMERICIVRGPNSTIDICSEAFNMANGYKGYIFKRNVELQLLGESIFIVKKSVLNLWHEDKHKYNATVSISPEEIEFSGFVSAEEIVSLLKILLIKV